MNQARWPSVEELFHAALGVAPEERAAFLEAHCAGEEGLRREVESLLAHFETTGSPLEGLRREVESLLVHFETTGSPLDLPLVPATTEAVTARHLSPGTHIGSFQVREHWGSGGMGQVYKAFDTRLQRTVALKLIAAPSPERLARFRLEARAISALNHPHIVTLYDFFEAEGECVLVTEFIAGETLRQKMATGPLPVAEVVVELGFQCWSIHPGPVSWADRAGFLG